MSAVITPHFRRRNAQRVYEAAQAGTDRYYIGLGKNDPWLDDNDAGTYVVPTGSDLQVQEALMNLIAIKRVDLQDSNGDINGTDNNISFVVPNVKWTSGGVYKSWDPSDTNSFYADTASNPAYATYNNALFICAKRGNGASTIAPTATGTVGTIVSQNDGYSWVKIQESTNVALHPLFTKSYYPIFSITNAPTNSSGKIVRVDISPPAGTGAGLTTGTGTYTVSIIGNGTGGLATVVVSAEGVITSVTVTNAGQNYTFGTVDLSGISIANPTTYRTTGAPVLRVICAPKNGFASDPVNQLPTWFLGFTSTFDGDEGGQFLIDNGTDYRQISLIKNPSFNEDSQGLNTTALLKIKFTSGGNPPVTGKIVQFFNGNAKVGRAFVDYVDIVDNNNKFIYVHQNYSTDVDLGTITTVGNTFRVYDPVTRDLDTTVYTIAAVTPPEYLKGSGEVVFLENRGPIKRSSLQVESIKIILQF